MKMRCDRCMRVMENYQGEMVNIRGIRNLCPKCMSKYKQLITQQEEKVVQWFYAILPKDKR